MILLAGNTVSPSRSVFRGCTSCRNPDRSPLSGCRSHPDHEGSHRDTSWQLSEERQKCSRSLWKEDFEPPPKSRTEEEPTRQSGRLDETWPYTYLISSHIFGQKCSFSCPRRHASTSFPKKCCIPGPR